MPPHQDSQTTFKPNLTCIFLSARTRYIISIPNGGPCILFVTSIHQTTKFFRKFYLVWADEKNNKFLLVPNRFFFSVLDQWKVCFLFELLNWEDFLENIGEKKIRGLVFRCHELIILSSRFLMCQNPVKMLIPLKTGPPSWGRAWENWGRAWTASARPQSWPVQLWGWGKLPRPSIWVIK